MTPYALLFTIAAIGISEAVYLIRKRFEGKRPVCLLGETCHIVLESKYSHLFGVHNDILGLGFYIFLTVATAFLVIDVGLSEILILVMKLALFAGTLMSILLLYIQGQILKAWCFWCVMSAITIFLMAIIAFTTNL